MDIVKKVGRKKIYTEERKQINIRLALKEYDMLAKQAEKENKKPTEYALELLAFALKVKQL